MEKRGRRGGFRTSISIWRNLVVRGFDTESVLLCRGGIKLNVTIKYLLTILLHSQNADNKMH